MSVVLVLVSGIVIAGERSLQSSREVSAAQSVQGLQANETVYQRSWGGFSLNALSLGGAGTGAAATCLADQEMVTTATANPFPAAYDAGVVQGGYTYLYKSGGTGFAGSGGCGQNVQPTYDFTANPVDKLTKSFCSDSYGTVYLPAGTDMANTGKGCLVDNPAAIAMGQ
jgi:hypothetical protein